MSGEIDYDARPDLRPGFWPEYQEPTALAAAIQMPLHPTDRWINGVLNAHIKRKRSSPTPSEIGWRQRQGGSET